MTSAAFQSAVSNGAFDGMHMPPRVLTLLVCQLRQRAGFMREAGHDDDADIDERAGAALSAVSNALEELLANIPSSSGLDGLSAHRLGEAVKSARAALAKAGAA